MKIFVHCLLSFHVSTPCNVSLYAPYNKHITKWLFWNCQKSYKKVSHACQLLVICWCYCQKGYWAKVGNDISTILEMTPLQSWSIVFFLYFTTLLCGIIMQHILLIFDFFSYLHALLGTARLLILLKNSYLHVYLELKIHCFKGNFVNFTWYMTTIRPINMSK